VLPDLQTEGICTDISEHYIYSMKVMPVGM